MKGCINNKKSFVQLIVMDYRIINSGDIDSLMVIWKVLMKEHKAMEPELYKLSNIAGDKQRSFFLSSMGSDEKFLYGAFDGKKLVGYAFGWIDSRPPVLDIQKIGNLSDLIIDPSLRGAGVGKELVNIFIDWCKSRGVKKVQLNVLFDKDAVGFYKKQGFRDFMRKMILDIK